MHRVSAVASSFCLLLLTGCATPYQPHGFFWNGYESVQIQRDTHRVSFEGNSWTSPQRAEDFALLRAAELCLESGYEYFVILDANNTTSLHFTGTAQQPVFTTPCSGLMIRCLPRRPEYDHQFFNALEVVSNLRKSYRISSSAVEKSTRTRKPLCRANPPRPSECVCPRIRPGAS